MKKAGIVLIFIGLALTIFTTVTFFTREKIVDIGDLHITAKKPHQILWSPILGIVVMGIGGVMTFVSSKRG